MASPYSLGSCHWIAKCLARVDAIHIGVVLREIQLIGKHTLVIGVVLITASI